MTAAAAPLERHHSYSEKGVGSSVERGAAISASRRRPRGIGRPGERERRGPSSALGDPHQWGDMPREPRRRGRGQGQGNSYAGPVGPWWRWAALETRRVGE
jgi:hypothetical protein